MIYLDFEYFSQFMILMFHKYMINVLYIRIMYTRINILNIIF